MSNREITAEEIAIYLKNVELPARQQGPLQENADEILRYGSFVGSTIECHERLERAMERARQHIDSQEKKGISVQSGRIILARSLTASKGRFSRCWHAPPGGLWGCLIHANTLTPKSTLLLSLGVGVAACEALAPYGAAQKHIRWVNDVLIDGVKVAGFLIEGHRGPRWGEQFHLIGFGINVNNRNFPEELQGIATSLQSSAGVPVDLKQFSISFIAKLAWNIGLLYFVEARMSKSVAGRSGFRHPVLERWTELSDTVGKKVVFGHDVVTKPQYSAVVTGVADDGGLQMMLDSGASHTEYSGEIRYLS
ncbi:MAG: biotin--[acetyl-CoA-carboxylase] ligase [Desulfopila sp.]|jgi:BirA family biotin operon repressor/biotin-[acetyl-CoA-carboxylase] ligase|nr:biotin--[acetyl-CoA-carboxylase] ligase [Desulfopila sp.]